MSHEQQPVNATATHGHSSSGSGSGGGFFSRLKGQAEAALAKAPVYSEIQHTLRQAGVQANPRQSPHTLKVQLAVKGAKGLVIDHEAVARESKSFSKNVLDLARLENLAPGTDVADIQDVGDRLALLTYKQGELHAEYAKKVEQSRLALKEIRNFENSLSAQRDRRVQLEKEVGKLRTQSKPDTHHSDRIADVQDDLDAHSGAGTPLAAAEARVNSLRRQKLAEAYRIQFEGLQELGEKLAIIAGYGKVLLEGWNTSDTAGKTDYIDGERTAAVRSGVETALSAWTPNKAYVPKPSLNAGGRSYAPSFHDSHSVELASIPAETDPLAAHNQAFDSYYNRPDSPSNAAPAPAPSSTGAMPAPPPLPRRVSGQSIASSIGGTHVNMPGSFGTTSQQHAQAGVNPFADQINTAPVSASELAPSSTSASGSLRDPFTGGPGSSDGTVPLNTTAPASTPLPTVAETGAPISGTGGPSTGILRAPSNPMAATDGSGGFGASSKQEEAREELNRRFEEYSQPQSGSGSVGNQGGNLERDMSLRGRNGGESLPAYVPEGSAAPAAYEKRA